MFTDEGTKQQQGFLARLIVMVALLSFAYILVLMTPQDYRRTLQGEISSLQMAVGTEDSKGVMSRANRMYQSAFVDTGAIAAMEDSIVASGLGGEDFWRVPMIRIVENIKLMFYQTSYRLSVFMYWFALAIPLIFALASDGFYQRKRKQYEFGVASANLFRIWVKAGMFAFFIVDVYFIFPAAGVWGVLLPPVMFVILGFALKYALSNVSKVF